MARSSDELLHILQRLQPSQFEEVVFRLRLQEHHLSPSTVAQTSRAIELLKLVEQAGRTEALAQALAEVMSSGRQPIESGRRGLMDLHRHIEGQQHRLDRDPAYSASRYVAQHLRYRAGPAGVISRDALDALSGWLLAPGKRCVVVLGDPGTGKTFLLHQLARRLAGKSFGPAPLLVEMRDLGEIESLDQLVARHLGQQQTEALAAFREQLAAGQLVLLLDGLDELVPWVSHRRAAVLLDLILEGARGQAKILVTSRGQFLKTNELTEKLDAPPERRVVTLLPFETAQIHAVIAPGPEGPTAEGGIMLLETFPDLFELAQNPRMLAYLCAFPVVTQALAGQSLVTEAYRALIEGWLAEEQARLTAPLLTPGQLREAVTRVALLVWRTGGDGLSVEALTTVVAELGVSPERPSDLAQARQQLATRSVLVCDERDRCSFLHRSVLEWLVAEAAAKKLAAGLPPIGLDAGEMSDLMADFMIALAGTAAVKTWAEQSLGNTAGEVLRKNTLRALARLGCVPNDVDLRGLNLRAQDLSGRDVLSVDLREVDLSEARFVGARLSGVSLWRAQLVRADLRRARIEHSDLRGADLSFATLLGADLRGTLLGGALLRAARLVGARYDEGALSSCDTFGAALDASSEIVPSFLMAGSGRVTAFSADGELLATGEGGTLQLWEVATGRPIRSFVGHWDEIRALAFSPDGQVLASSAYDRTVRLWGVTTGRLLQMFESEERRYDQSLVFRPDGNVLAVLSGNEGLLWDISTGRRNSFKAPEALITSLVFLSDGSIRFSSADLDRVGIWDLAQHQPLRMIPYEAPVNRLDRSAMLSPDGRLVAIVSSDLRVRLFDVRTGQPRWSSEAGTNDGYWDMSFSQEGHLFVLLSSGRLVQIERSGRVQSLGSLRGGSSPNAPGWSEDGRIFAIGGEGGGVQLWEVDKVRPSRSLPDLVSPVYDVSFSPGGDAVGSISHAGTLRLWKVATGELSWAHPGSGTSYPSLGFSPDGRILACSAEDGAVRLLSVATGEVLFVLRGHRHGVQNIVFGPDNRYLACGGVDGVVELWDWAARVPRLLDTGHKGPLWIAFGPDGHLLVTSSSEGGVRIWETSGGQLVTTLPLERPQNIAFSPDGQCLAILCSDRDQEDTLELWSFTERKWLRSLVGHEGVILKTAFSPDGRLLASASTDHTVRLWEVATGKELRVLEGHHGYVLGVAFSPDGRLVASCSNDNTVRLWDVETGRCHVVLLHLPAGWVAFTPDGRYKTGGEVGGHFWHAIGLCRFEPGELDPYAPHLRLPLGASIIEAG